MLSSSVKTFINVFISAKVIELKKEGKKNNEIAVLVCFMKYIYNFKFLTYKYAATEVSAVTYIFHTQYWRV